jgi:hypothetical protein
MDLGACSLDYLVQGKVTRESTSFLYAGEAVRSQAIDGLATDTLVRVT